MLDDLMSQKNGLGVNLGPQPKFPANIKFSLFNNYSIIIQLYKIIITIIFLNAIP